MANEQKLESSGKKPLSPQCECYQAEKEYVEALLGYSGRLILGAAKVIQESDLCEQFEADLFIVLAIQAAGTRILPKGQLLQLPPIPDKIAWWREKAKTIEAMIQRIEIQRNKELH